MFSSKAKMWIGLCLIFFFGVATGAVGTGFVVRRKIIGMIRGDAGQPRRGIARFLTRELDLDRDQRLQVEAILEHSHRRIAAVRQQYRPQMLEVLAAGYNDIRTKLKPSQQARLDELYQAAKTRIETDAFPKLPGENAPDVQLPDEHH